MAHSTLSVASENGAISCSQAFDESPERPYRVTQFALPFCVMYTLRMLGEIGLSDSDNRELDELLRQPKHVALLAFISLPRPGDWHRRDTILGTFWAEHDQSRARSALRSALYTLRKHLPEGAIISRGDNELSVDGSLLQTDVTLMRDDIAAKRYDAAIARYRGPLLPGLYVPEAPEFDKWLEAERNRIQTLVRECASLLTNQRESAGDIAGAIESARYCLELAPADEGLARRLIALLDASGDRAGAFATYDKFRNLLSDTYGVRPSAETVALLDAVRTRRETSSNVKGSLVSNVAVAATTNGSQAGAPVTSTASPTQLTSEGEVAAHSSMPLPKPRSQSRWWLAATAVVAVLIATLFVTQRATSAGAAVSHGSSVSGRTMVVLPMSNETGKAENDYIATAIVDGVSRRLEGVGGIRIRSGARADWPAATRRDLQTIERAFGATFLLSTSMRVAGDSLELSASVIDSATMKERAIATHRFTPNDIRDVESKLAADIAGAVFRVSLSAAPHDPDRNVDSASYRMTIQGFQRLLSGANASNQPLQPSSLGSLFKQAVDIDPQNARAWSGLSSLYTASTLADKVEFDVGFEQASAAAERALKIDPLEGTALANLGILSALKYRKLSAGIKLIDSAIAAEPSNPEVFLVKSVLYRNAHMYDEATDAIRFARSLDPLSSSYPDREAIEYFCTDRPKEALEIFQVPAAIEFEQPTGIHWPHAFVCNAWSV